MVGELKTQISKMEIKNIKKQWKGDGDIIVVLIGIVLVIFSQFVSAIYAGDCLEVNLSELESLDNVVYSVVGNSSNLEGMIVNLNNTTKNVSICFVVNYKPDNFTLIFIDNSTKEIIVEVPVYSSGGSRTKTIEKETYIEIDNYIDREVPIINNTDIQRFEDDLKKLQDDLDKKNKRISFLLFWGSILSCLSIYLLIHIFRKKITKLMIKPKVN